jgi:hypothetical protein
LLIVKLATLACLTAPKRLLLGTTGCKDAESNIILVPIDLETTILQSVPVAGHDSEGMARVWAFIFKNGVLLTNLKSTVQWLLKRGLLMLNLDGNFLAIEQTLSSSQ